MQNIIRLLQKFRIVLLFLLLQAICFFFIIGGSNSFHRSSFASSSNQVTGWIYEITSDVSDYFHLEKENEQLVAQNKRLNDQLAAHQIKVGVSYIKVNDTFYHQQYEYLPAKVINSSISNMENFITINIGSEHKVEPNMAVIGTQGVVGKTIAVSSSFATVKPIINQNFQMTARHRGSKKFGKLVWEDDNYYSATVIDVPSSVTIHIGDVFETRGDDGMFPEAVAIGTVTEVIPIEGETYQNVKLSLVEDFSALYNVSVVKNYKGKEQLKLEQETKEQFGDESNN
ncbi:rod shape-determining protein MreC [Parvicella tangerina]|uniref:Cell shape-determining protein MreC n=1 Tax=Parvicella tangerina TaxID=2829795 RepID=A0A916JQ80_9FLAO|nr:rod shape-determining protein MreC [Parvicella tangerina]CAG5084246.1 hypothetical protein CRYO30217_02415 [Parvicella tangerina]